MLRAFESFFFFISGLQLDAAWLEMRRAVTRVEATASDGTHGWLRSSGRSPFNVLSTIVPAATCKAQIKGETLRFYLLHTARAPRSAVDVVVGKS